MLDTRRDTRAYLVVYHGADSTPGMWRRVGTRQAEQLTNEYGVAAERISVLFAGYREEAGVELWLLPADAPPPVEAAVETRKPLEATQLGADPPDPYAGAEETEAEEESEESAEPAENAEPEKTTDDKTPPPSARLS